MIEGAGVAAGGTLLGTRAAGTLGIESAAEANASGSAPEPASFESNLNRMMESLNAGFDKPAGTGRREGASSPLALSADKEGIADPRGGIRSGPGVRTESFPGLEGVVIRTALMSAGLRGAQPARHPERVSKKQTDAEEKSGLTGAGGNSGAEVPPAPSAFLMMPNEPGTAGMQGNRTREGFGASLDPQRGRASAVPTAQEENVLPDSAQPNLFKGEVARSVTETSEDGSNPIAVPDQTFPNRFILRPEPSLVESAGRESLGQAVEDAPSSAGAAEPATAPALPSNESIEARSLPSHAGPLRAALKGAPPQDMNGRLMRHETHADTREMEREESFAALATQQGMDPGRPPEAGAAGGQGEQRAYNLTEAMRPAPGASTAPAASDPFSALDADQAAGSMSWIRAGAHRAEAGYLDPALGWVSVRAEAVGGGIHAAVVPGSPEAAHALGGHMTGLSSHLAQQHGNTATVILASAREVRDGLGWSSQTGGGDRGAERHSAGSGNETRQTVMTDQSARSGRTGSGATRTNVLVTGRSGSTISVMA